MVAFWFINWYSSTCGKDFSESLVIFSTNRVDRLYLLSILEPVWPSCSFFLNDLHPWRSPGSFPLQKLLVSSRAWHDTKCYKMEIMTTRLRFKPGTPESLDRCSNNWANWHHYWSQSDHHKMMDQTGILIPTSCS